LLVKGKTPSFNAIFAPSPGPDAYIAATALRYDLLLRTRRRKQIPGRAFVDDAQPEQARPRHARTAIFEAWLTSRPPAVI
jgi:hypothetical protein